MVSGTELPIDFKNLIVVITCGKYEIVTRTAVNQGGTAEWLSVDEAMMELPEDVSQLPDVIVYLAKEVNVVGREPICFTRFPVRDILQSDKVGPFWEEYKWITLQVQFTHPSSTGCLRVLQEDKSLDALPAQRYPGALLMKLGMSTLEQAAASAEDWKLHTDVKKFQTKTPFAVRVHVYQGADLPAADDNGLLDPYLKVKYKDVKQKESSKLAAPLLAQNTYTLRRTIARHT